MATARSSRRYDAFKVALQNADPTAPDEQNWFRKIKVSDPLQYFGLVGEYLSETVGTNLLPTARAEYYDLRSFAMSGEPHWYGTPASAWRDQEFTRLMRRYISYKMA